MDWTTTAMTAVCVATTGGLVAHHNLTKDDLAPPAVRTTATESDTAWEPFTRSDLDEVLHTTTTEIETHELALAANRWHERLADARREIRRQAEEPPRAINPNWGLSSEERQQRHDNQVRLERREQQRRRQVAVELRSRRESESIFTRSERYRRQGSAYPAVNLNRQIRINRQRSIR